MQCRKRPRGRHFRPNLGPLPGSLGSHDGRGMLTCDGGRVRRTARASALQERARGSADAKRCSRAFTGHSCRPSNCAVQPRFLYHSVTSAPSKMAAPFSRSPLWRSLGLQRARAAAPGGRASPSETSERGGHV
ncbi:hypothetical protein NDU88_007360 [Pleurodeles waltl]|uniref:Uncharacterized protein n=1 Tax=Pleurodeles waltl TaxID=8319 RepID=A0AAV7WD85_PLEWA|nr:hypothetical protein NDU88_007360 [Pleurodeles waltl]